MESTQSQQGFTLIELIVVIVILGILAATALPKFIDLKGDAAQAATDGVAGALASATSINYAARLVNTTANTTAATTCSAMAALLAGGVLPTGYAMTHTNTASSGGTVACTVTNTANSKSSTFTAIGS